MWVFLRVILYGPWYINHVILVYIRGKMESKNEASFFVKNWIIENYYA